MERTADPLLLFFRGRRGADAGFADSVISHKSRFGGSIWKHLKGGSHTSLGFWLPRWASATRYDADPALVTKRVREFGQVLNSLTPQSASVFPLLKSPQEPLFAHPQIPLSRSALAAHAVRYLEEATDQS